MKIVLSCYNSPYSIPTYIYMYRCMYIQCFAYEKQYPKLKSSSRIYIKVYYIMISVDQVDSLIVTGSNVHRLELTGSELNEICHFSSKIFIEIDEWKKINKIMNQKIYAFFECINSVIFVTSNVFINYVINVEHSKFLNRKK
ncbi:hypothetical protein KSF78_0003910 [Schistosoma japonicum]|nr:hypothetical protein KSF78_0003910 [Schistosoma japonicum]